jgi:hypothetical protein
VGTATVIGAATRPSVRLRAITEVARTTPGRYGVIVAVLLVLCTAFGVAAAVRLHARSAALDDLVTSSEPLAIAAQDIYRALSDADATAASAFLEGGVEPPEVRRRYENDIAQAGSALAAAASAATTSAEAGRSVTRLSTYLPVYAGLVEQARANNRRGWPLGAAYLREASGLMQSTLLPAARELYEGETGRLAGTERRATPLPLVEVLLGVLAIGALVAAQVYLRRRTNRVLNIGLLAATAASALVLLWVVVVAVGVALNVGQARDRGSTQVQQLATARIAALEARGDETLTLVARGAGADYEKQYAEIIARLGGPDGRSGMLGGARDSIEDPAVRALVQDAIDRQQVWRAAHAEIRRLDDSGAYNGAVAAAIGPQANGAAAAFTGLDDSLGKAIGLSKQRFDAEVASARSMLSSSVAGVVLLTALAAAGAVWGMWQRLKEYT